MLYASHNTGCAQSRMAKHYPLKVGSIRLSKLSNKYEYFSDLTIPRTSGKSYSHEIIELSYCKPKAKAATF